MAIVTLSGTAKAHTTSPKLISLVVSGCPDLVSVFVTAGTPCNGIYNYVTKSAAIIILDSNFIDMKTRLSGGNSISISLSYDTETGHVTEFCYDGICLSTVVHVDTVVPKSEKKAKGDGGAPDASVTGTDR